MSNRHPSTPPPLEHETANPFFTTPQIIKSSSKNFNNIFQHQRKNSNSSTGKGRSLSNNNSYNHSHSHSLNNNNKGNNMLFTPQTPCLNNNYDDNDNEDEEFPTNLLPMSPQTTIKKNNVIIDIFNKQQQQQQRRHMNDPLRTPETTPRHLNNNSNNNSINNNKRKDILLCDEGNSKLGHILFNTNNQSIIGSGRRGNKKSNLLEFKSSIKINFDNNNNNNKIESNDKDIEMKDNLNESTSSSFKNEFLNCDYEDDKEKLLMNYNSSEYDSDEENQQILNSKSNSLRRKLKEEEEEEEEEENILKSPMTPPMQIMNDDYIMKKFNIEKNKFKLNKFEDERLELEEVRNDLKNIKKFPNPFFSYNEKDNFNKRTDKNSFNKRFLNEIEMVYHATGEKFYVELSEEGKKIQPKRLNFEEFKNLDANYSSSGNNNNNNNNNNSKINLLQTPPMSSNHKMSIKGLLNYESEDKYEDEYEGIKHEKIKNPFKGKFDKKNIEDNNNNNNHMKMNLIDDNGKMEFLNQTTGKHIVEEMDEDQLRIKPKKLDFSGC
ncbi:kinase-regulated stress-responsive transcription factor skn7 [Pichia californica]|nr:kinase-regulated stress-responsive transcription factor skn7 [[Candida] californica]